jgi:hypothetical protein
VAGVDLAALLAARSQRMPKPASTKVKPFDGQEMAAAVNALLISLATTEECRVCKGANWLGKHDMECPVPELEKTVRKSKYLSTDELPVDSDVFVRKVDGVIHIHGVPYDRWIYLNAAQRIDVITRKTKPRVVKIVCCFCTAKTFIVTPLRSGQRITECFECWCVRSRPVADIEAACREAIAKARWARAQKQVRATHRLLVREYMLRAKAYQLILEAVREETKNKNPEMG